MADAEDYQRRKDEIAVLHKARQMTPEGRAARTEAQRRWRAGRRALAALGRMQSRTAKAEQKKGGRVWLRVFEINGKPTVCSTINSIATRTGVSTITIFNWIRDGVIPPPEFVDSRQRKWYSEELVDCIAEVVLRYRDLGASLGALTPRIREAVKALYEMRRGSQ